MGQGMPQLTVLLPERRRFAGQALSGEMAASLGRADRLAPAEAGEKPQLLRYFQVLPRGWPMAAITRQAERGDAALHAWLRADPVFVRPDAGGARLMGWGNLGLGRDEAEAFLRPLKPLFGDSGFPISATDPDHWYLMLPREAKLPAFTDPVDGLGEDLLAHLPDGPEGKRWRALLNEAQILLHNHPRNAERLAAGLPPVNSLWFWGGGVLPDAVSCACEQVVGDDPELRALAELARGHVPNRAAGSVLQDLRRERDWRAVETLATDALADHRGQTVVLDFADGARWQLTRRQRWRFWRRRLAALDA
jgi:hypothetical protein